MRGGGGGMGGRWGWGGGWEGGGDWGGVEGGGGGDGGVVDMSVGGGIGGGRPGTMWYAFRDVWEHDHQGWQGIVWILQLDPISGDPPARRKWDPCSDSVEEGAYSSPRESLRYVQGGTDRGGSTLENDMTGEWLPCRLVVRVRGKREGLGVFHV